MRTKPSPRILLRQRAIVFQRLRILRGGTRTKRDLLDRKLCGITLKLASYCIIRPKFRGNRMCKPRSLLAGFLEMPKRSYRSATSH